MSNAPRRKSKDSSPPPETQSSLPSPPNLLAASVPDTCRRCEYWVHKGTHAGKEVGECRVEPPSHPSPLQLTSFGPLFLFPLTIADTSCGRFSSARD